MTAWSSATTQPWIKYFADDAMYMDEKGRGMDKAALVKSIEPLPNGYSGNIKLVNPKSHIENDTAILSYDLDETETIFGQNMTARYHGTDTWMYRNGKWRIVAGQMLRYYEDPAAGKVNAQEYPAYAGIYKLAPGNHADRDRGGQRPLCAAHGPRQSAVGTQFANIFSAEASKGASCFSVTIMAK